MGPLKGTVGLREALEFDVFFQVGYNNVKLNRKKLVTFDCFWLTRMATSFAVTFYNMLHYTIEDELILEGEFDETVLKGFNQKNTAFEQLREMGLQLTSEVFGFEAERGEGTYYFSCKWKED